MTRQSLIVAASLLCLCCGLSAPSFAQDQGAKPGFVTAKSEQACFGATSLLTNDTDWKSKWDAYEDAPPEYETVDQLNIGDQATLLLLFSCPELIDEEARIECDLKMTRADGSAVFQQGAVPCFQGKLTRAKEALHLAQIWLDFNVTAEDGTGPIEMRVGLTDRNIGERISLSFPVEFTGKSPE